MKSIFYLIILTGLTPGLIGFALLEQSQSEKRQIVQLSAAFLCALAFNLTFFWQELWLVIPKAMTPGLHPTLYHNNHDWTGENPIVELLQGTGAVATLVSGLVFIVALVRVRSPAGSLHLFVFWMAFQGLNQSITQLAIGALLPGNDVGRALTYLHVSTLGRYSLLGVAVIAYALTGAGLASLCPSHSGGPNGRRTRDFGWSMLTTAMIAVVLVIPFRVPNNIIEVVVIPFMINLIGIGWLILGGAIIKGRDDILNNNEISLVWLGTALCALLIFFQFALRTGVKF